MNSFLLVDAPADDKIMKDLVSLLRANNIKFEYLETPYPIEDHFQEGDSIMFPSQYNPDCDFTKDEVKILKFKVIVDRLQNDVVQLIIGKDKVGGWRVSNEGNIVTISSVGDAVAKCDDSWKRLETEDGDVLTVSEDCKSITIVVKDERAVPYLISRLKEEGINDASL